MNNQQKIAAEYVAQHKKHHLDDWQPLDKSGLDKLDIIYAKLVAGDYGFIHTEGDPDGDFITDDDWRYIEIPATESITGNPIIFEW